MDALLGTLAEAELAVVREVSPERLPGLDEDELLDLHTRIRRQRDKYVKQYRRQAAASIEPTGGRGKAHARNARARAKAELFETILASVSRQLAVAAQANADALHAERLADEQPPPVAPPPPPPRMRPQRATSRPASPDLQKRRASSRATTARRQARKDKA
jgi:ribonuclease D